MTYLRDTALTNDDAIAASDVPSGLQAIRRTGCAAAIWQRAPLPRFQSWIDALAPDCLPSARMTLHSDMVCDALLDTARICGLPECPERDLLIEDAAALSAIFSDIMRAPYLRLRLAVVNTNACRKFHVDAITARLICTYRGTGTQYGISNGGTDPDEILTVPTGSPMIMRGKAWPEAPITGFVHRSPPIEGAGETRLVLVLDPVGDLEEPQDTQTYSVH